MEIVSSKIIILEIVFNKNNYYPVYGSVRVLAWPHFQIEEAGQNKRKFGKINRLIKIELMLNGF